jgi:GNAT superfamily N-acetyltransferase
MELTEIKTLNKEQKKAIIALWNREYPEKLGLPTVPDFENYLQGLSEKNHIVLMDENQVLKGWLIYFVRDEEPCFAMLLDASLQGKGWGSRFLDLAKQRNDVLYGWVIPNDGEIKSDGGTYKSPVGFYLKNGFEVLNNIAHKKKGITGIKVKWKKSGTTEKYY